MNFKNTECEPSDDNMCKSCHLFYASEAFKGLCSSCFKYLIDKSEKIKPFISNNPKSKSKSLSPNTTILLENRP